MNADEADRFDDQWMPEPNSGCRLWLSRLDRDGYGDFYLSGRMARAHRVAWARVNGEIPTGLVICHRCDTPCCVNPDHMFLGTDATNASDRDSKKRQARGERQGLAKLTEESVVEARRRHASGRSMRSIAADLGVGERTISDAIHQRTWKHVPIESPSGRGGA